MNRRDFLAGIGASAALAGCRGGGFLTAARARRLNILYIMTDDHAAHAIGAYGSRINRTPHMDALARDGVRLSNCFCTNPICAPSRGGILTGEYSHRNGVPVFNAISRDKKTVGGYMRDAGYATYFIGKWHLGNAQTMRDEDWDRWMVYDNQGVYFDPYFREKKDGKIVVTQYPGEYATENITRICKAELEKPIAEKKPFFMMMHHKAPHRNWLPSDKYRKQFRDMTLKDIPMPDSIYDAYEGRATPIRTTAMTVLRHMRPGFDLKLAEFFRGDGSPRTFTTVEGKTYEGRKNAKGEYVDQWPEGMDDHDKMQLSYLRYMQDYLACVQSVDDSVGEMVAFLKEKGVYENTLVCYTSDQGFFLGDHGLYDKRFIMEEVVKMPFIAACPALIPAGQVNDDVVTNIDFAPTFLEMAGAEKPVQMQGESFLRNLEGDTPWGWKKDCYCRYYVEGGEHATAAWYGVCTKTDKLVYYYNRDEWEYFDLKKDPDELVNAYGDNACQGRIAQLKKRLAELREELGDHDQYKDVSEYGPVKP